MRRRNAGCRINKDLVYKGWKTVILENEKLRVTVLADKGTDIIEFLYKPKDIDFMWMTPAELYHPGSFIPTNNSKLGNFMDFYPGGWQEILPNAGPPSEYKGTTLGQHGEISLLPWDFSILVDEPEEIAVKFSVSTVRTPFYLEKILRLKKGESTLFIEERLKNEAKEEMECIWGHHPAIGEPFLSEDCEIKILGPKLRVTPGDGFAYTNLEFGKETDWPYASGKNGEKIDISKVPSREDKTSEVIFLTDLKEGFYSIHNKSLNLSFSLTFPKEVFSTLWFWRVAGGSFHYPWYGRTYNIALEPFSSLPILSEQIKKGKALKLKPGEIKEVKLIASVKEL